MFISVKTVCLFPQSLYFQIKAVWEEAVRQVFWFVTSTLQKLRVPLIHSYSLVPGRTRSDGLNIAVFPLYRRISVMRLLLQPCFFFSPINHAPWVKCSLLPVLSWRESKQFIPSDIPCDSFPNSWKAVIIPACRLHVFSPSLIGVQSHRPSQPSRQEILVIDGPDLNAAVSVTASCTDSRDRSKWYLLKCPCTSV